MRSADAFVVLFEYGPESVGKPMFAAQGVAVHCAIMDNFRCAADPATPPLAIKFRANAVAMNRMFCTNLRELTLMTTKPFLHVFNVDPDEIANPHLAELGPAQSGPGGDQKHVGQPLVPS